MSEISKISTPLNHASSVMPTQDAKEKCGQIVELLSEAFAWDETAEGDSFWRSVSARLNRIAKGLEPLR